MSARDNGLQPDPTRLLQQARELFDADPSSAANLARQALTLARQGSNASLAAQSLNLLADIERREGRLDSATSLVREALDCATAAGDAAARAYSISILGSLAWHQGNFAEAVSRFEETLAIREQLSDIPAVAAACGNLALLYRERGDLERALRFGERSLALREKVSDRRGIGAAHLNLGVIHADIGDWDRALENYLRSLTEAERVGDKAHAALCHNNIGEIYLNRGKLAQARYHLEKALVLAGDANAVWIQVEVLGTLGETAFAAGDFARALDCYERDRQLCLATNDREELAETLRRWAELLLAQGELADARERIAEALKLCEQTGSRREEGNCRRVLAQLTAASGNLEAAIGTIEESLDTLRPLGNGYELACSLLVAGQLSPKRTDRLAEALSLFQNLGCLAKATEVEELLAARETAKPDLLADLAGLAARPASLSAFCSAALTLMVERLPVYSAAIVLSDGQRFSSGPKAPQAGRGIRLDVAGRTVGRLLLERDVPDTPGLPAELTEVRLEPVCQLLALGIAAGLTRPATRPRLCGDRQARYPHVIGAATTLKSVLETVEQVAPTRASVLVLGESGTGKELIARLVHQLSDRRAGPFVAVNCAAIPENLLEAELLGVERGAATGVASRKGRFEAAHGGTLFLDEIGDMSLALQAKLLRVVQEMTFERVGSSSPTVVDVRIVCATNRDLEQAIVDGRFRRDLFYRLNVITVRLPPLRERREDIPALAETFVQRFAREYGRPAKALSGDCMDCLMHHDWPGNVRELENILERAVIICNTDTVTIAELPGELQARHEAGRRTSPVRASRKSAELQTVIAALESCGWVVTRAAAKLGISRRQLHRIIREHGITRPQP
ncbi:MAG: sigma 54-interacting transcriptional regulator [candidate division WOR-3 bacterium]